MGSILGSILVGLSLGLEKRRQNKGSTSKSLGAQSLSNCNGQIAPRDDFGASARGGPTRASPAAGWKVGRLNKVLP